MERTTFFFGLSISPATNVTFSHATELKTEPTIAEAIPPIKAKPEIDSQPDLVKFPKASFFRLLKASKPELKFSEK